MKAVILAGGFGTRLAEETSTRPKPMVEIGGKPILWHIMKIYSSYGINEFIICLGYKGYVIKEYFSNYFLHMSDVTLDMATNQIKVHNAKAEPWKVTLLDTGEKTMTGGRLKRAIPYVRTDDAFCMTYGDGVADVNLNELLKTHKSHGRIATVTGVHPTPRFGALQINEGRVRAFQEKPAAESGLINGGFFVLSTKIDAYLHNDETVFERKPLEKLAEDDQLAVYPHPGFWQPMDTLRDRQHLESLWESGAAPWKLW
jgi:glucose-1-phosphate cytidylyltransferase